MALSVEFKTEKKEFSNTEPIAFFLNNRSNQPVFFELFRGLPFHVRLLQKNGGQTVEAHTRFQMLKRPANGFSVQSLAPNQEFRFLLNNRKQFESLLLSKTNNPDEVVGEFQLELWIGGGTLPIGENKYFTVPELGYSTELKPPFSKLQTNWFKIKKK